MANICELFPCQKLKDGLSCECCYWKENDFDEYLLEQKNVDLLEVK